MIKIDNVSKSYDDKIVLQDINLTLATQQTHALLGLSGSGKSTLLRIMIGLQKPDAGQIWFGGEPMTPATQRQLSRQIGYVIQQGGLFPHMTIRDNVTLVARTLHWDRTRIQKRVDELLELVDLESDLLNRYPSELSGGQIQRVGIVRASFLNPPYLLLDEPLGALDPILRRSLQQEMKRIFNRMRCTVVFVTHDVAEAAYFGHTITLLNNGRILQHGTFEEFQEKPVDPFVTKFIRAQRFVEGS